MTPEQIKEFIAQMEAIVFAAGEPVGVEQICKGLDLTRNEVDSMMETLIQRYEFEQRGIRILKLDSAYQMCSAPEHGPVIRSILESRSSPKLSQPAIEVLAIIAYNQPTTRIHVDQIRGVDSAYTVGLLADRGLIEECGKLKDVPGRPLLYRTTKAFLRSFHMESLDDLPDLGQAPPEDTQLSIEQRLKDIAAQEAAQETESADNNTEQTKSTDNNTEQTESTDNNTEQTESADNNTEQTESTDHNTEQTESADHNTEQTESTDNNTEQTESADHNTEQTESTDDNTEQTGSADNNTEQNKISEDETEPKEISEEPQTENPPPKDNPQEDST